MSIQSTIDISRKEAEDKYVENKKNDAMRKLRSEALMLDNKELENAIDEEFYNYRITD